MADGSSSQDQDKYASGGHAQAFNKISDDAELILSFEKAKKQIDNTSDPSVNAMQWMLDNADGLFKALKGHEEEAADIISKVGFAAMVHGRVGLQIRAADIMEEHALEVVRADPNNPDALKKGLRILQNDFFRERDLTRNPGFDRSSELLPPSRRLELQGIFNNRLDRIIGVEAESKYGLPPVRSRDTSTGPAPGRP